MNFTRREVCALLPAMCAALSASSSENDALRSAAYPFESLPVSKEGQAAYRDILEGRTRTGDYLEAHETVLEAGAMPHPAHHHEGEELFLISSGTLEVTIVGKKTVLGPGSAFFCCVQRGARTSQCGRQARPVFCRNSGPKSFLIR